MNKIYCAFLKEINLINSRKQLKTGRAQLNPLDSLVDIEFGINHVRVLEHITKPLISVKNVTLSKRVEIFETPFIRCYELFLVVRPLAFLMNEYNYFSHLHLNWYCLHDSDFEELIANLKNLVKLALEHENNRFGVMSLVIVEFLWSDDVVKHLHLFNYPGNWGLNLQQGLKNECNTWIIYNGLSFERKYWRFFINSIRETIHIFKISIFQFPITTIFVS